jgi:outer membrane cobalamin receptor
MKEFRRIIGAILLVALLGSGSVAGAEPTAADHSEETMLMFVGETLPVVTVASRYPESPATAPAMVTVIGREEIRQRGYQTLAEALADQPGFFMAAGGRGTVPYLRGLRDSVLFLYDGVPITTDVTKNFAALDREISLAAVERIEIVRGPGSVLWGADAFAGVVNIVPRRGQRQAAEFSAGLLGGTQDLHGASLSWGQSRGRWDAFLALSGTRERFYADDYTAADQTGSETLDYSDYAELVGTLNFADWLRVSGRWSDFTRRYSMENDNRDLRWAGAKQAPFSQLKITASKAKGSSHYTLSGFLQTMDYQVRDADIERRQKNQVTHLELLWDKRFFNRGLFTLGASWRENRVKGAVVHDGFLPDLLAPEEPLFIPQAVQEDFSNRLLSAFSQFRYQLGKGEWWAGLRLDDHSQYERSISYSFGLHQPLTDNLRFKAAYGTAFRSPYSSQLFDNETFDPERISTASTQLAWTPGSGHALELTLFYSQLENHRSEDPYGGLSISSDRESYGVELAGRLRLADPLHLQANVFLHGDDGGVEQYHEVAYFVRPDGSRIPVFVGNWDEPIDQGPDWLANLGLNWQLGAAHNLFLSARIGGSYAYSYNKGSVEGSYDHPLLLDLYYRRPGFFTGRDSFSLRVTNLLDRDYQQADVFGPIAGPPLQASLLWQLQF